MNYKRVKSKKGTSETVKIKDLIFASMSGEGFLRAIKERLAELVDKLEDHNKMYWLKKAHRL